MNKTIAISVCTLFIHSAANANWFTDNTFNPQITVILDGKYSHYKNNPEDYRLPGFFLGGEAGLAEEGFALGHNEIMLSANADDKFYGQLTLALADHDGHTDLHLEEAFIETLALGEGFTIRAGRFFSAVGYLNQQHEHSWDFSDAPLVYRGMWGRQYTDDGLRLSWVVPTDVFVELGAEAFAGGSYPAGGEPSKGIGSSVLFVNVGDDIGVSHSWQAGVSYYHADVDDRESGNDTHDHGDHGHEITTFFSGDSDIYGINGVYKWAPQGNYLYQHFKLQGELFIQRDDGTVTVEEDHHMPESSSCRGDNWGFYVQGIYQFHPQWAAGVRYDYLDSDAKGSDDDVLEEADLLTNHNPQRWSVMLEWLPSEFSRIRVQYNRDDSYQQADNQFFVQYTMSLGTHGAHLF